MLRRYFGLALTCATVLSGVPNLNLAVQHCGQSIFAILPSENRRQRVRGKVSRHSKGALEHPRRKSNRLHVSKRVRRRHRRAA